MPKQDNDLLDKGSFMQSLDSETLNNAIGEISGYLFDEWYDSNLDEGTFFADYRFAEMSGDPDVTKAFHEFWDIKPEDEHWLG